MSDTKVPSDTVVTAGENRVRPCPNCGAGLFSGQKYCIRCGLRCDPAALERLAMLDVERRAILASLLPAVAAGAPPIQATSVPAAAPPFESAPTQALSAEKPPVSLPTAADGLPTSLAGESTTSTAWLLKTMVYGGVTLMAVGALIYLREVVLESPALQLALLTGVTAGLLGLGVRGLRHQTDDLLARGWLWLGALLLPLDFWAGVYHGVLPTGVGWGYAVVCAVVYWLLSVWLADRGLPHLAVLAALTAGVWFGLDRLTTSLALTLVVAIAAGFAAWSATHPFHIAAPAGWWWGGATIGLCASVLPVLDEFWLGGVAGLGCFVMGRFVSIRVVGWLWVGAGLWSLTVAYGRWLGALELSVGWMTAGWAGWLLALAAGRSAATRWASESDESVATHFRAPLWWAEQVLAGALGLWALVGFVAASEVALLPGSPIHSLPIEEAYGNWLAWFLVMGWGGWQLCETLSWFPLGLVTLAVLASGGVLVLSVSAHPLAVLVLPGLLCAARLGVELLGVYFGKQYSTEVDTSFGLDFGLAHHPDIVPSRVILDISAGLCLVVLVALAAGDWKLAHTLGLGLVIGYSGLCWFAAGVPTTQRAYALAMWSLVYVGLLSTICGAGRAALIDVTPSVTLVAAAVAIGLAREIEDEPILRWALREVSVGMLGFGVLVGLTGVLMAQGHEVGHGLAFVAATSAGWVVAVWRQASWLMLAATLCGGLASVQVARCAGSQPEVLPLIGILYGFTCAWLGWRWQRHRAQGGALWSAMATAGQIGLWLAAFGGLVVIPPSFPSGGNLATGASLVCAAGALTTASFVVRQAVLSDLYALGGLVWGAAAYVWWLSHVGLPVFANIAYITLPYGVLTVGIGWLKQRFQRGYPVLSEALIWLGSLIFCVPVVLQALQRRLTDRVALSYDVVADAAALVALVTGLATGWRAPSTVGAFALSFHLGLVVVYSVPWGDIPYSVYLTASGLTLFVIGTWLWRHYR
ncbi:hypothetical protein J8C06_07260 [Chloracidobacterium validum]|uniref:Zinc ribbon domain-containing protein n=1 Tax=Chloracidobacterium validum TaxID=2821543 RepID=A0ABX8B5F4_9BACT|nr:TFIIB-type zinc finger domain-containing protein [Chloracidobacterium validum]QUW02163.1 hypothetical protein J8C06_07260 [Chloracidobacterium validum]